MAEMKVKCPYFGSEDIRQHRIISNKKSLHIKECEMQRFSLYSPSLTRFQTIIL